MLKFFILGVVQGMTEFLPVSSSGHLSLLSNFFLDINELEIETRLFLFVWLHLATIVALVCFFYKDIKVALKKRKVLLNLAIVTLVTAVLSLTIKGWVEEVFTNRYVTSFSFLLTALLLLGVKEKEKGKDITNINVKDSFFVGVVQTVALLPGVSRSGITIVSLIRRGVHPVSAFKFSFLMAIPIILGGIVECGFGGRGRIAISEIIVGCISAFLSGLLALIFLKRVIIHKKLHYFGYYCLFIFVLSLIV